MIGLSENKKDKGEIQDEYKELYDFNDSLYITIDANYIIQKLNFKAAAFLGRDRHLLIHHSFYNYVTSFSKDIFKNTVQNLISKEYKQCCEIELLIKGGGRRQVQLESTLDRYEQIQLCLIDITCIQQKNNQIDNLQKEIVLLNQLLNASEEAIAALDENLCFKIINPAFYNLFVKIFSVQIEQGFYLEKILINLSELKEKIINACNEALEGKKSIVILENTNYDSKVYYYYEIKIYSLINDLNNKQLIFRIRDLTEYKFQEMIQHEQQSKISSSSRLSTMEEMMSALAHEINQPLTVINTYSKTSSYLLQSELSTRIKLRKIKYPLEQISIQAEHAGKIIHSMKNLLCNESAKAEVTNINLLIKNTISIINYEFWDFKIKINLELMNNPPVVSTNKIQIMQVILNLARNSIEALQNSQTLNPAITIQTRNLHTYIMITVQDNGPGIPPQYKNKILNTFFTTKAQGTGIGLAICRSIIERHAGEFNFLDANETGATFYFTLPIKLE